MPIEVYQSVGASGFAPGVTLTNLLVYAPVGRVVASPAVPPLAHYRQVVGPVLGGTPLSIAAGLASGTQSGFDATFNRITYRCGGSIGANAASMMGNSLNFAGADGPWVIPSPGVPEPSQAVFGFAGWMRIRGNNPTLSKGFGWKIGVPGAVAWTGGPLAAEGSDFQSNGTWPYVVLWHPAGGGALQVRVRSNSGAVNFYVPSVVVDPLQVFSFDWRIYRATLTQPARYELYLGGVRAWSQSMSEGVAGSLSASPAANTHAHQLIFWNQGEVNASTLTGAIWGEHWFYTGYDDAATVDRSA